MLLHLIFIEKKSGF